MIASVEGQDALEGRVETSSTRAALTISMVP